MAVSQLTCQWGVEYIPGGIFWRVMNTSSEPERSAETPNWMAMPERWFDQSALAPFVITMTPSREPSAWGCCSVIPSSAQESFQPARSRLTISADRDLASPHGREWYQLGGPMLWAQSSTSQWPASWISSNRIQSLSASWK